MIKIIEKSTIKSIIMILKNFLVDCRVFSTLKIAEYSMYYSIYCITADGTIPMSDMSRVRWLVRVECHRPQWWGEPIALAVQTL